MGGREGWRFVGKEIKEGEKINGTELKNQSRTPRTWTSPPSCRAVLVPADVSRFIRVVATIVVEVTAPQDGDALPVVAGELRLAVAGTVV